MSTTTTPALTDEEHPPVPTPEPRELRAAVSDYLARVRGGDVGSLPAILGLVVLFIVFAILRPHTFTNAFNVANLVNQAAAVIVIAMGLVFVLLLGEIDLSAGWTAGVAAAIMGVTATRQGWPWWVAVLCCIGTGAIIGTAIGLLVARLGIPSFVVTLAAFLGLQGLLLKIIGEGGTIAIRDSKLLAINNNTLPVWLGWVLMAVIVAVLRAGLAAPAADPAGRGTAVRGHLGGDRKVVVLAVVLAAITRLPVHRAQPQPAGVLDQGRARGRRAARGAARRTTFVLARTPFGRHVYAVGGNAEAARRAGINVKQIKLFCFITCSSLAAVGGILLASRDNSISPTTGGAETLLYAVGAAGHRRHQPVRRQGQAPGRGARRARDRGDHQRHGAAQPAVRRRLHRSPVRAARRGRAWTLCRGGAPPPPGRV
jgi:D-xylose transport system permease protein